MEAEAAAFLPCPALSCPILHALSPHRPSYSLLILFQTSCSAAARLSPAAEAHFLAACHTPSPSSSPISDSDGLRLSWATASSCAALWVLENSDACTSWWYPGGCEKSLPEGPPSPDVDPRPTIGDGPGAVVVEERCAANSDPPTGA